nr:lysine-specific demethylase 8-like [Leptinotarsa decemlineata]
MNNTMNQPGVVYKLFAKIVMLHTGQTKIYMKTCCMNHWPATSKWIDVNYLLKIAGDRTVPIEVGFHYVDENWSQKLMTMREFIKQHYLSDNYKIGYLAQHNLFEQITELKEDILIPEYCCLSLDYENSEEPDINAWLGPMGTVSPLHHDPKNNILAQIYGYKQIILFSPKDSPFLYPHEDKLLNNTAQVNPLQPDLEKYPKFSKAKMYKCLLGPGEMLFIPVKWWHHVSALEKSFSVSFWWK